MSVICDQCKYHSGDYESVATLADKVNNDGGSMLIDKTTGHWNIICPNGHSGECIHLD
jgi:hypothetical protein